MTENARNELLGRDVFDLWACGGRYSKALVPGLELEFRRSLPRRVLTVRRRGKAMIVELDRGAAIVVTFGMSGRLSREREKHAAFRISHGTLFDVRQLYLVDPRHFGTVRVVEGKVEDRLPKLGWDALCQEINVDLVRSALDKFARSKTIGEALLDGRVFSGIGNYLRAEALWAARISPFRSTQAMTNLELETLCRELRRIVLRSRELGGCSLKDFSSLTRGTGKFSEELTVYGRKRDPDGNVVARERDPSDRTIWWVPSRQLS